MKKQGFSYMKKKGDASSTSQGDSKSVRPTIEPPRMAKRTEKSIHGAFVWSSLRVGEKVEGRMDPLCYLEATTMKKEEEIEKNS